MQNLHTSEYLLWYIHRKLEFMGDVHFAINEHHEEVNVLIRHVAAVCNTRGRKEDVKLYMKVYLSMTGVEY